MNNQKNLKKYAEMFDFLQKKRGEKMPFTVQIVKDDNFDKNLSPDEIYRNLDTVISTISLKQTYHKLDNIRNIIFNQKNMLKEHFFAILLEMGLKLGDIELLKYFHKNPKGSFSISWIVHPDYYLISSVINEKNFYETFDYFITLLKEDSHTNKITQEGYDSTFLTRMLFLYIYNDKLFIKFLNTLPIKLKDVWSYFYTLTYTQNTTLGLSKDILTIQIPLKLMLILDLLYKSGDSLNYNKFYKNLDHFLTWLEGDIPEIDTKWEEFKKTHKSEI